LKLFVVAPEKHRSKCLVGRKKQMTEDKDADVGGTVTDLNDERRKRAKKIYKADLYRTMADVINRSPLATNMPEFDVRYHLVEPVSGVKRVLTEYPGGVVEYVADEAVVNAIISYTQDRLAGRSLYKWDVAEAKRAFEFWKAFTPSIPEPPAIRWLEDEGLCFHRLPWQLGVAGEHPLFDEMFSRIINGPALSDWIGSLFEPDSGRQQYIWLYGQGKNGKGSLSRFLGRVFGRAYIGTSPPLRSGDSHWTNDLLGKRLVCFPDIDDVTFPTRGLFKSMTGGDAVRINPKNKDAYSSTIRAKFIFLSNEKPSLSSERADFRRAIFCEALPLTEDIDDATYEDRLWLEGGAFLTACIQNYRTHCPNHESIKCDTSDLEDHVSRIEEPFEVFFEKNFDVDPSAVVEPRRMYELLCENFRTDKERRDFYAWLERRHGVKKKSRRALGAVDKVYPGIKWKSAFFSSPVDGR
jgi:hypothetical protein